MNETLLEIVEQCHHRYSEHNINLELFTELVIKKCAEFIDQNTGYDDCNNVEPVTGQDLLNFFDIK
jgi:hypothetical protein